MTDPAPPSTAASPSDAPQALADRAVAAGYPPDSGPEQPVRRVRPAFLRGHPLEVLGWALAPLIIGGIAWFTGGAAGARWAGTALLIAGPVFLGGLVIRWALVHFGCSLEITNKRTVERRGVLSRSVNEVLHDHIRNVQVHQSFYERLVNVGKLGIASSGADGVEIQVGHLPDPHGLRGIIDLYRPL